MDRVLFTVVAYLPVISGALGIGFLSAYLYNRVIRKKFIPKIAEGVVTALAITVRARTIPVHVKDLPLAFTLGAFDHTHLRRAFTVGAVLGLGDLVSSIASGASDGVMRMLRRRGVSARGGGTVVLASECGHAQQAHRQAEGCDQG